MKRLAAAAVLAIALVGCQVTLTLDNERLEQAITDGFAEQTEFTLTSITCPDDRPLKQGDEFTCAATANNGQAIEITVTQTDDQGNVEWEVTDASEL